MKKETHSSGIIRYTFDDGTVWDIISYPYANSSYSGSIPHYVGWVMLDFGEPPTEVKEIVRKI